MIVRIFTCIGIIASIILGIALCTRISTFIGDAVDNYKYKKWLKSRFDGGPTAKCFCKDCRYYSEISHLSIIMELGNAELIRVW